MSGTVEAAIRLATGLVCRIEGADLAGLPRRGPYILVANHVNFLDIPILRSRFRDRPVTGLVKAETWDNPAMAWLFSRWNAIPIQRDSADFSALRAGLRVLRDGGILGIAPEGTRSRDGVLRRALPGVSLIALWSGAPIVPVGIEGLQDFGSCLRRGRRTPVRITVGPAFRVTGSRHPDHDERQAIADQIMYQLAACLDPRSRGPYGGPNEAPHNHIVPA